MDQNPQQFDRFDLGAPGLPKIDFERTGNIDEAFDDFSPDNGGGGSFSAPFTVTLSAGELSIAGGYYLLLNEATPVSEEGPSAGSFAYIQLKHSAYGQLDSTDPFSLIISETELDTAILDSGSSFIEYINCLLAEVVEISPGTFAVYQYRSGNVQLLSSIINGRAAYWPYPNGGSL